MMTLSSRLGRGLAVLGISMGMALWGTQHARASDGGAKRAMSFAVTAPVSGYSLAAGSTTDITWTGGNPNERLGIWLVDTDEWIVAGEIAVNIVDDGHESWTIPANLPPGDYQIYIENQSVTDWTYGTPFTVY